MAVDPCSQVLSASPELSPALFGGLLIPSNHAKMEGGPAAMRTGKKSVGAYETGGKRLLLDLSRGKHAGTRASKC